mgnify:CR=1 FL=1
MANFSAFGKRQKELARKEKQQAKAARRAERKQARESGQGSSTEVIVSRERGVVKWFDDTRGFGFIQRETGGDVFVHVSSFVDRDLPSTMQGTAVEFAVEEGPKGPQASEVYLLDI